jgi:uncharacterized protein with FMN-binding domain
MARSTPNVSSTDRGGFSVVPKRGVLALATTILAVLLLFSFKTGEQPGIADALPAAAVVGQPGRVTPGGVAVGATPRPTTPASGTTPAPTRPSATAVPGSAAPASASGTFTGDAIRTRYGDVQVAVVMDGGRIVDVQELQMPFDRRLSQQISDEAGPLLRSQVLQAQSAQIDGVSGASYTSQGFYLSLQSALAQAP